MELPTEKDRGEAADDQQQTENVNVNINIEQEPESVRLRRLSYLEPKQTTLFNLTPDKQFERGG